MLRRTHENPWRFSVPPFQVSCSHCETCETTNSGFLNWNALAPIHSPGSHAGKLLTTLMRVHTTNFMLTDRKHTNVYAWCLALHQWYRVSCETAEMAHIVYNIIHTYNNTDIMALTYAERTITFFDLFRSDAFDLFFFFAYSTFIIKSIVKTRHDTRYRIVHCSSTFQLYTETRNLRLKCLLR